MKLKNSSLILATIIGFMSIAPTVNAQTFKDEYKIQLQKEYTGAKHEPVDGCLLGAYVLEDPLVDKNIATFNETMGKNHATSFMYVGYGRPFPTEWVNEVKALGGVPHIAWEPNSGLDKVVDDEYLRNFAKAAAQADVPIQLRFASEANGTWSAYDRNANLYKEKWILVHDIMEEIAPKVSMLWTVFTFPEHTIEAFYPGDEYVDWVGVNVYNVVYHNDRINDVATHEDPLKLLDYVYNKYSYKKPIHISEFGVTHYARTDGKEHPEFAIERITRMYENLETRYPRVKAISYFNTNALNSNMVDRRINDYSLTTNKAVQAAYQEVIKSDHFLEEGIHIPETSTWVETFTYTGMIKFLNGRLYAGVDLFTNYLGLELVSTNGNKITLSDGEKTQTFTSKNTSVPAGFYGKHRSFTALPIREVCDFFGEPIHIDEKTMTVTIY